MDWKTMLGYVSGSVDEKLILRNGYLVAENRVLRNQIQGRLRLTDAKRPGATVLSPFVFLDTTPKHSGCRKFANLIQLEFMEGTGHLHGDDPPAQDDCKAHGPWSGRKHRL